MNQFIPVLTGFVRDTITQLFNFNAIIRFLCTEETPGAARDSLRVPVRSGCASPKINHYDEEQLDN